LTPSGEPEEAFGRRRFGNRRAEYVAPCLAGDGKWRAAAAQRRVGSARLSVRARSAPFSSHDVAPAGHLSRCAAATDAIIESFRGRLVQTGLVRRADSTTTGTGPAVWPGSTVSEHSQRQCLARLHAERIRAERRPTDEQLDRADMCTLVEGQGGCAFVWPVREACRAGGRHVGRTACMRSALATPTTANHF
jgi:hypothetical protein